MPQQSMISGLLLFRLGVELGQITVLLFAYLGVGWLRRRSLSAKLESEPASVTIAGVGLYWLIKKTGFLTQSNRGHNAKSQTLCHDLIRDLWPLCR